MTLALLPKDPPAAPPIAREGFHNFGTPNYYVLDSNGVVRFDQRELQTVVRNASLLLAGPQSTN